MKSAIKQIIVIILLCIAIFLLLAIIFYDSMPISIVVPSNVSPYVTSSEVKEEVTKDIAEFPKQYVSFEITDSDLNLYKRSKSYDPTKANPFATPTESTASDSSDSSGTTTNANSKTTTKSGTTSVFDTKIK